MNLLAGKPLMTDAQYRAMQAVANRDGDALVRFKDCSVSTLLAMSGSRARAKKHAPWVELVWGDVTVKGRTRRSITHATFTTAGLSAYQREKTRREKADQAEARAPRLGLVSRLDPFDAFPAAAADLF